MRQSNFRPASIFLLVMLADGGGSASAFVSNAHFNRRTSVWSSLKDAGWQLPLEFVQGSHPRSIHQRRKGYHPGCRLGRLGFKGSRDRELRMLSPSQMGDDHCKYEVVFVRHGQSTWNKANRFIGWTDTELTEEGEIEARVAGQRVSKSREAIRQFSRTIKDATRAFLARFVQRTLALSQVLLSEGFEFDIVYTSMLKRAIKTAWVLLDELSQQHVPVIADWHLNERCYGALVGREKKDCVRQFGEQQVKIWRRSFDIPPPPIDISSKLWPGNNPRYKFLMKNGECHVPRHESLKDVMHRASQYWEEVVAPAIRAGKRVCVCGHENNLRSLLKYIDNVSNEDIINVELPRAVPLIYHLDEDLKPVALDGSAPYLSGEFAGDPEEIAAIMDRDLKNVYDLNVARNLEESDTRFAAKIVDVTQPCSVEDLEVTPEGELGFTGSFLETGVGEDSCRESDITSTPLFMFNRGQKPRKRSSGKEDENPSETTTPVSPVPAASASEPILASVPSKASASSG